MRGMQVNGEQIAAMRKSQGLTQEQLAFAADIDVTTLRKMEKGERRFDLRTLNSLSAILQCDVAALIVPSASAVARTAQERIHLACVERHREAILHKNVEQALSCLTEDAVIFFPPSIPTAAAGEFIGHEAIRQHLILSFATFTSNIPTLEESDVYVFGECVLLRHVASALVIPTGLSFQSDCLHEYRFRDGLICKIVGLFDTAAMAKAFTPPPADD